MSTGIVQVRLSGEPDDVTRLAALIAAIPGITGTGVSLRENYRDPGVRGYLTVTINDKAREPNAGRTGGGAAAP